jgi:hypothetical protein
MYYGLNEFDIVHVLFESQSAAHTVQNELS